MPDDALRRRLRAACLALPEAVEEEAWGDPTWRVRGRIFTMEKRGDGRVSAWMKAPPGAQEVLAADPARFFVPPYVGPRGWIGLRLEDADWDLVVAHVATSYRLIAPKRLAALVSPACAAGRVDG
jgi:predicted DNA-binding protein (MmcQ/YjbR family)